MRKSHFAPTKRKQVKVDLSDQVPDAIKRGSHALMGYLETLR